MESINRKRHKLLGYLHTNSKAWKKKDMGIALNKIRVDLKLQDDKKWGVVISQLIDDSEIKYYETPNKQYRGVGITITGISSYSVGKYKMKIQWWNIANTLIALSALIFSILQYYLNN